MSLPMSALSTPAPSKNHESVKLMLATIVILLYLLVIIFDFLPTQKNWAKKGKWVYCVLLSISFIGLFLYSLDVKIPGSFDIITRFFETLSIPAR